MILKSSIVSAEQERHQLLAAVDNSFTLGAEQKSHLFASLSRKEKKKKRRSSDCKRSYHQHRISASTRFLLSSTPLPPPPVVPACITTCQALILHETATSTLSAISLLPNFLLGKKLRRNLLSSNLSLGQHPSSMSQLTICHRLPLYVSKTSPALQLSALPTPSPWSSDPCLVLGLGSAKC